MNDQNECQKEDCEAFLALPFKNKLFFTSNIEWASKKGVCFIQKYSNYGYVVSDTNTRDVPINVKKYLNSLVRNH